MLTVLAGKIKEEGIKEGKIETAKKLFRKGMDLNEIAEISGLLVAELKKLLK